MTQTGAQTVGMKCYFILYQRWGVLGSDGECFFEAKSLHYSYSSSCVVPSLIKGWSHSWGQKNKINKKFEIQWLYRLCLEYTRTQIYMFASARNFPLSSLFLLRLKLFSSPRRWVFILLFCPSRRSIRCLRNIIHWNLITAFILRNATWFIVQLTMSPEVHESNVVRVTYWSSITEKHFYCQQVQWKDQQQQWVYPFRLRDYSVETTSRVYARKLLGYVKENIVVCVKTMTLHTQLELHDIRSVT